ncbi:MAG: hypothetical protein JNN30_08445 [Rhodanobacteraceae bacterium]|nr:hypothetical protein [Rhodanobacteraceae bacterium]
MNRYWLALLAMLCVGSATAQDLATVAITMPQSGCALTANESVTVWLFNYGPTLPAGSTFNVAYSIGASVPVTENVVLGGSLLRNSRLAYTFTTPADLSTPGNYTLDATVNLAGDINPTNNTHSAYAVTNWANSVGGTVSGPAGPTLNGSLTLSGHTGAVLEWQHSDDGNHRWRRLVNATTSQTFAALREHTAFRALVRNGPCAPVLSTSQLVLSSDPIFYSGLEP